MKNNVILYGGAFNPPTLAHQAIAQAAVDYAYECGAELWIMPSGERYDKSIHVDRELRVQYIEQLIVGLTASVPIRICDMELMYSGKTETAKTVSRITQMYPDTSFRWLFGSDSVNSMHDWRGGSELLQDLKLLIVERPGLELVIEPSDYDLLSVDTIEVSSTLVRSKIANGESVAGLVPEGVLQLLRSKE